MVADSRKDSFRLLDLPCYESAYDRLDCVAPSSDFEFCSRIIEKGYDSMQIYNSQWQKFNELVICTDQCEVQPVKSSCPPLELRTGWNATKTCSCNENYPILNCNNSITDALDCHHIEKEPEYKVKQTCYFSDFNWINTFQKNWSGATAIFVLWDRHGFKETLPKIKTILDVHKNGGWSYILAYSGDFSAQQNYNKSAVLDVMDMIGFQILPILRQSESEHMLKNKKKYQFHMLSLIQQGFLKSVIIKSAEVKFGLMSYSVSHIKDAIISSIDELVQLIIDEALCLKRTADIIVLLSSADITIDKYVSQKVSSFVDIIVGGNSKDQVSCHDKWHTSNDNVVIHSQTDGSYLTMISVDQIDQDKYSFKSKIVDLETVSKNSYFESLIETLL